MTKKEFIAKIAPHAAKDMHETNVAASLTIAQAALESAWGGSGLTVKANNLFGIKGKGPAGSCTMRTKEYVNGKQIEIDAAFRAYHNWGESINDHSKLVLNGVSWDRNKYKGVIGKRGADAARAIAAAGYATDPKYAQKLISIMNEYNLYQYDEPVKPGTVKDKPASGNTGEAATVELDGKQICSGIFINGLVSAPVRKVAEALGANVGWDGKRATVNGKLIIGSELNGETAFAPVREVAEAAGGKVIDWIGKERKVIIQKL
ncbi:glucosaminidase domain-containing protein [Paenibacillus azoreducens]|uniref:glucosaminidase domain-containing protein n=1 Tax=Paenibacillus azoreducens TaxID=116718 RepID=UPI0039F57989